MVQAGQRKCLSCGHFFDPDRRNRERQRYCSAAPCRRASKAASQAHWLADPANAKYHSGPLQVARVEAWRAANPGYGAGRRRSKLALQDALIAQIDDSIEEVLIRTVPVPAPSLPALQDLLNEPSPVLAGLIAHLFEVSLQDDMALTTRRLVQLGHDMINRRPIEDRQTRVAAGTATPGAQAVQLG